MCPVFDKHSCCVGELTMSQARWQERILAGIEQASEADLTVLRRLFGRRLIAYYER